jgi:beta-amylase
MYCVKWKDHNSFQSKSIKITKKHQPTQNRKDIKTVHSPYIMKVNQFILFILLLIITLSSCDYVPVYVMMPLTTVTNDGQLNNVNQLQAQLKLLKSSNVDGIMVDVWWGIVQRSDAFSYDWSAYGQLFQLCQQIGLKVQVVMAFHQCGTNVGDACYIPLPKWVLAVGNSNPDIFYTDMHGHRDQEYLSLGVDNQKVFPGNRTAVDLYSDFMKSFASTFQSMIGKNNVITTIEVGLGPAGEMRYPSYQLQDNIWTFPGIGEFQCYDKYMLYSLNQTAYAQKQPLWGKAGPSNAGNYGDHPPSNVPFYSDGGFDNWDSDYGRFFLAWYSQQLINHGDAVLSRAQYNFVTNSSNPDKPVIAGKIAGIHWWYMTFAHAAELTAGYYNTYFHDGYIDIANMFKKYNIEFAFTCLEMLDVNQNACGCGPQELVQLTREAAWQAGIRYSGENALTIYNSQQGYDQIIRQSKVNGKTIDSFTYLRMTNDLFSNYSWSMFSNFVNRMHNL